MFAQTHTKRQPDAQDALTDNMGGLMLITIQLKLGRIRRGGGGTVADKYADKDGGKDVSENKDLMNDNSV